MPIEISKSGVWTLVIVIVLSSLMRTTSLACSSCLTPISSSPALKTVKVIKFVPVNSEINLDIIHRRKRYKLRYHFVSLQKNHKTILCLFISYFRCLCCHLVMNEWFCYWIGKVKQWDADNFENVVTLTGHHGEIWALTVTGDGKFVVTAGHDRSIRLWERTSEPLVLEDERETEREAEADLVNNLLSIAMLKRRLFITQTRCNDHIFTFWTIVELVSTWVIFELWLMIVNLWIKNVFRLFDYRHWLRMRIEFYPEWKLVKRLHCPVAKQSKQSERPRESWKR